MGLWEDHNTYVCGAIGWERAARTCNCNVTVWYVVKWSGTMYQQCSPVHWLIYSYTPWSVGYVCGCHVLLLRGWIFDCLCTRTIM